ncbi:energy transducer TonB, partial [Modicisalibacter radicis]|uniref:energy transducer TonB n=1 Tax=Halomonas sp. EAR18 TaxID=2518972 RepID=UPI00109D648B
PEPEPAPQPPTPEPPPKPEPAPRPDAPPEPAAPPEASSTPDAQALLAQASASVRERGFDASAAGGGGGSESQKAAQRAAEARYIDAWSRRVEEYGNRYYPAPEALDGQLRIRVVIGRDGQLRQAEVIQSSQQPELDQAALDTVRGAAPYRPFDRGMGERDSLTITRVWQYGKGNNFGVR